MITPQCSFGYFIATAKEGYDKFGIMLCNLKMPIYEARKYDPEGFVMPKKRRKDLSRFSHCFLYIDDIITFFSIVAIVTSRKEWMAICDIEEDIMKRNSLCVSPYDEI